MRSLAQHWRGANAYAKVKAMEIAGKSILVDSSEAHKRAAICVGDGSITPCPFNVNVRKNHLELAEDNVMLRMVGGHTTTMDEKLGTCGICTCNLKALVHVAAEVVLYGSTKNDIAKYPAACWKHTLR